MNICEELVGKERVTTGFWKVKKMPLVPKKDIFTTFDRFTYASEL